MALINSFLNEQFSLNESADNNFKLNENKGKFSCSIENTVGKREIACYEQFLLYSQSLQKISNADTLKQVLVSERVDTHSIYILHVVGPI